MVATASALAVTVQMAGEDPASAGCIWEGTTCIEEVVVEAPRDPGSDPGSDPRDNPGSGGEGAPSIPLNHPYDYLVPDLADATYNADRVMSTIPTCRAFIDGPKPIFNTVIGLIKGDPQDALRVAIIDDTHRSGWDVRDGQLTLAVASTTTNRNGVNEHLEIYEEFHQLQHTPELYPTEGLYREPTPDEVKTMVIIHEVAHMTGRLPANHTREEKRAFDRQILEKCLGF